MAKSVGAISREMVDREAIRECIVRTSRAIDRIDEAEWRDTFWPEAVDNHAGLFEGRLSDLIENVLPGLRTMRSTTHFLGNILIEIEGSFANAETYVFGCHVIEQPAPKNIIASARYLDRFECRRDEWRLLSRNLVIDWFMNIPADGEWSRCHFGHIVNGRRMPDDPSFKVLRSKPE